MSTSKDRQKQINDKCQSLLAQMLRDDDNKYCVDCDAKGPRWASWNLGIFLCIRCAGIHRNLGVHISKVKSVNLDTWTPEQVVSLQSMGNSRARAVYEANLPDSFRRPQNDSALEAFIRAKYEQKKYIAREWVQPPLPKVNWDKELEEEEKARRKKRESKTTLMPGASVTVRKVENVIPQPLPKPTSSPKSQRNTPPSARHKPSPSSTQTTNNTSTTSNQQPSTDLLGLDTPVKESGGVGSDDDMFSGFLTAPSSNDSVVPSQQQQSSTASGVVGGTTQRTQEEENFFSQVQESGTNRGTTSDKKLDTDSILALYAKSAPQQTVGGVGGYVQGGVLPPGGQMAGGYCQPFQLQNGILPQQQQPTPQPNPQGNMFVGGGAAINPVNMASNPFYNMAVAAAVSQQHQQSFQQQHQQQQQQHMQNRLTQQMSGLNIGMAVGAGNVGFGQQPQQYQQPPHYQQGHTLANNLWQ